MGVSDWIAERIPCLEDLDARACAWFARHPVVGGALFVGTFSGILPALALGYLL